MKNLIFIASITCAFLFSGITVYPSHFSHVENFRFETIAFLAKPPKPNFTSHKNNDRISSSPTIKGSGVSGNQIELHVIAEFKSGKKDFGTFTIPVKENGTWILQALSLWLPENTENPTFVLSAVQVDSDGKRSVEEKITLLPESDFVTLENSVLGNAGKDLPPAQNTGIGEVIVRGRSFYSPNDTLSQPKVIFPSPLGVITGMTDIQFIGEGVPGATVEIDLEIYYTKKYNFENDVKLSAVVNDDGIWVAPYIDPKIPEKAINVFYRLWLVQIAPNGGRSWMKTEVIHQKL